VATPVWLIIKMENTNFGIQCFGTPVLGQDLRTQDLNLTAAELATDYRLSKLNEAGNQVDAVQGNNARNNILIGDAIINVPDAATSANMVIIGDGDKVNAKSGTIALGNGALVDQNILQIVGADLEAVADAAGADTTKFLRFNYKGTIYKVTLLANA
jgi:hypothetical protein